MDLLPRNTTGYRKS